MLALMNSLEEALFLKYRNYKRYSPVFIVGAPRTGTTIIYQALLAWFDFCYFSNLINDDFPEHPIIGALVHKELSECEDITAINRFGHTVGQLQPSEGTKILNHWYSAKQPAQSYSTRIESPAKSLHIMRSLDCISGYNGKPLLIKNAWNCFRIESLNGHFTDAKFIWIIRNANDAAKSDLNARYVTKGSPYIWNTAKPSNIDDLSELPYWAQVVENQYEYNKALQQQFKRLSGCWKFGVDIIHYEDFCQLTSLSTILSHANFHYVKTRNDKKMISLKKPKTKWDIPDDDAIMIDRYYEEHRERLNSVMGLDE